jgi:hypothetical protein
MLKRADGLALPIFALLLLAATYIVAANPDRSYDSYLYSYLVGEDAPAFKTVPGLPDTYAQMPDAIYVQQAPLYTIKVLFVALVRLAAPIVGVLQAPPAISAVAYFLCGWVTWFWLRSLGLNSIWRTAAACLIMFSSVVTDAAVMGTPDLLCTLLLVAAAWLLTATKQSCLGACLLILAVWTRTDCLVLGGLLLALAWLQKKTSLGFTTMFAGAMLASSLVISKLGYSYRQVLENTLLDTERTSYGDALLHNFLTPDMTPLFPFVLLSLIALKLRYQVDLIVICAASLVVRYLLFPNLEARYLVPQGVIVAVVAAAAVFREQSATAHG